MLSQTQVVQLTSDAERDHQTILPQKNLSYCKSHLSDPIAAIFKLLFYANSECPKANKLRDVVVHSSVKTFYAVTRHRIGRHRDDRHSFPSRSLKSTNRDCGGEAVHLWHLTIHQNTIVGNRGQ